MKKIIYSVLSLAFVFVVSSLTTIPAESKKGFTKTSFVIIDIEKDSSLFKPYSKAWRDSWPIVNAEIQINSTNLMNAEAYQFAFNDRAENLFTLIHPKLISGELTLYSPYDPQLYGLSGYDDGELRYPVKGENEGDNFLTSETLREQMIYYLGYMGPQSDFPLIDEFGDPVTATNDDGSQSFVYPPRDYYWNTDKDIVKYKIRIKDYIKKDGSVKKRVIESIAPIILSSYDDGQTYDERELFWIDFQEAKPFLKKGYFFNEQGKPITYLKYLEQKVNE